MRRWWFGAVALAVAAGAAPLVGRHFPRASVARGDELPSEPSAEALSLARPSAGDAGVTAPPPSPPPAPVLTIAAALPAGLELTHIGLDDRGTSVVSGDRVARLTLDPELQRTATSLLEEHKLPEAAVVLVDTATGHVLVYASHVEHGRARDLCAEASKPSASVFKIITGSALVENAGLGAETRQCYSGGEHEVVARDLEDSARDRSCTTLGGAMGRSINTVFARLALKHLKPDTLRDMAESYGFDQPVPFDAPNQASTLHLPADSLGYARTAAGFWNSMLSPLEAAWIGATVARGGEAPRLSIVREVTQGKTVIYSAPPPSIVHRATTVETAQAVTAMMEHTVAEGTSFKAFHDVNGSPYLPGITVAGKTGTLASASKQQLYTWFAGFAPSKPMASVPQVAIAVLVVNEPTWHVKANVIAREMLRAYFAEHDVEHVTAPKLGKATREKR